ncbi:MAG TPA: hypothetical protein DCL16_07425 [Acidimicrobiaceae bacterium]|nr:hypothetical protein [Acidimicrobiaceae bacterium]
MITERLLASITLPAAEVREQPVSAVTSDLLFDSTGAKLTDQARITIDRINHYRDTVRAYQVKIDGQVAGRIKDSKQETFEISPGTHQIRVRLMWLQSPSVQVHLEEGDEVRLRTGPNGGILQAWRIYFAPHTAMFLEESDS